MSKVLKLMLLLSLLLSGCGYKDIDKRFFVVAVGLDKGQEKKYRVTLELAIPSPEIKPGNAKSQQLSEEADTISEAIRLMKSSVDKEFDFGHTKMIILGKPLLEDFHPDELDYFFRRRDIQRVSYVAIGDPTASEILEQDPPSERLPANSLFLSFGREGTESSYIVTEYLFDFFRRLKETGKDPFLPIIQRTKTSYKVNRVAVFDKHSMKAVLSADETRVFNQLVRNFNKFELRVNEGEVPFFMSIISFDKTYSIRTPPGQRPYVDMTITLKGVAEESTEPLYDHDWNQLEQWASESVERRYVHLLQKLQKLNVDPLGLGLRYIATRHHGEKDFEAWKQLYPDLEFRVNVVVRLQGTGIIR